VVVRHMRDARERARGEPEPQWSKDRWIVVLNKGLRWRSPWRAERPIATL